MDRDAIRKKVPDDLKPYLQNPIALKGYVEDYVAEVLRQINIDKREPDQWEATDLLYALGLARCGLYHAALA